MTKTERTYLDWNATAPLLPAAREAVLAALDSVGNPSSVHGEGRALRMLVEAARRDVAALLNAAPAHVIFTSGATEAANLALTPDYRMGRTPLAIGRLYVSEIEHPAIREGGRFARDAVTTIPVTRAGLVDLEALTTLLAGHDKAKGLPMVAVMLANNETGIVQPVKSVAEVVHRHGGLLVVDAVQAAGRVSIDIAALDADFLIVSSHKLGGPKGAGALISRGEVLMPAPLIRGGGQEKGHRSGTENPAALAGFAAAARAAVADLAGRNARIGALRDALESGMRAAANDVVIHGADVERIANTSFFSLPGLKSETGQIAFDLEGIALSAGSACSSGKVGQSHVLTAMGFDTALGGLRVSLGPASTEADVARFLAAFSRVMARRRAA
ncbi:cysteine desulfurase family protein [Shinella sp. 838]|jgi:cysteine desulfurase|uniref:cysteine desulfurase family protein n=1 Tax=unclassified Shinella TaxID=2643062 RepID=UPI000437CB7E|nr:MULTISPECIES: cysteine desulfurase family protein [unclassified Shinella]EYR79844.1 putative cysteine desulfurase 1 [Shinella sp. DD12]MCA0343768.1 cysteine desulfurase [Pseudomonadota bacterium]MDG4674677.1 cysteine desulfurase family protein [Shinella sp. 838]